MQLTDYFNFEANVIRPAIRAAHSQAPDPGCPVFSAPHPSLEETLQFLLETDYNHPGHRLQLPPPLSTPKLSATIPLTHLDTSILTILSAILLSALAPFLPESIPGDIQGLR